MTLLQPKKTHTQLAFFKLLTLVLRIGKCRN